MCIWCKGMFFFAQYQGTCLCPNMKCKHAHEFQCAFSACKIKGHVYVHVFQANGNYPLYNDKVVPSYSVDFPMFDVEDIHVLLGSNIVMSDLMSVLTKRVCMQCCQKPALKRGMILKLADI